ncbi:hypothetical protein EDM56_09320 [Brevibacillus fluminis]|uniref:ACT domain-containing protein n=1 Tax=Brevibacillus fluminis TaxID=511487 RepID=A0A3M8DRK2_9BACL|nr:ACT domain-containing protein [Brevibacillus fluminis]RNB90682.1 hypothetical protein EDM56_09320 [Brevibacillus fluminis]
MNQTFTLVVNDQPDVLLRIIGVLTRYNVCIKSFSHVPAEEEGTAIMTFSAFFEEKWYDLVLKQLVKLIDVIELKAT